MYKIQYHSIHHMKKEDSAFFLLISFPFRCTNIKLRNKERAFLVENRTTPHHTDHTTPTNMNTVLQTNILGKVVVGQRQLESRRV